jgi:hypothetical protein
MNVTKENLSVIDRQIAAASTASSKKSKKRHPEPEPERNAKKPKVDHPEAKVVLHKAKVVITYGRADKRRAISLTPQSPAQKMTSGKVKEEDAEKVNLQAQPRANNGRFAKKFKVANVSPGQNKGVPFPTSSHKRRNDEIEDLEESPRKKSAHADKEDEEVLPKIQKVVPRRVSGFHSGRLFSKPNPQQFALKAWSNMMVPDDASVSSEDDSHPITPEDNFSSRADIVDPEAEMINSFSLPRARASLSCINPSPLNFAKNRWNSFGQGVTTPKSKLSPRKLSLDELYISEAEVRVWNRTACASLTTEMSIPCAPLASGS